MAFKKQISQATIQAIVEAYKKRVSLKELTKQFASSQRVIQRVLSDNTTKRSPYKLSEGQKLAVIAAYGAGDKLAKIAKDFGISEGTAWLIIDKAGKIIRQKRISKEEKIKITDAYNEGKTTAEIALQFDICVVSVQKAVKSIQGSLRKRFTTPEEQQAIIKAYESGKSSYAIADEFGFSRPSVCNIVKGANLKIRGSAKLNKVQRQEIISLYKSGVLSEELANQHSLSRNQICRIIKRAGVGVGRQDAPEPQKKAIAKAYRKRGDAQTGANSHRWRGGITKIAISIRTSARYAEWRKAVFVRDKFTCQHCNDTSKKSRSSIEADHIYPFSVLLYENNIKSREDANECSALWNIDNGRTLCRDCHKKTDTYSNGARKIMTRLRKDSKMNLKL